MKNSTERLWFFALWLASGSIAVIFAMGFDTAAYVDGHYIPTGNDSFYHARRILDAAIGPRGFYQFDNMIHAPEGSWITWPWAYDYLLAQALRAAMWINPSIEPMAFLAHVPVAWIFVNAGLMLLVCRKLKLGLELTAVALLAFSLSPLTQLVHGLGMLDHHFMELTFALASIWLGLGYFDEKPKRARAIAFGLVLGIAPGFHNGLFILQLPLLATAFLLWIHQSSVDAAFVRAFCISLIIGTLVVLVPSGPFLDLQFEFGTLSWFHLYIASCTAICLYYLAHPDAQFSVRHLLQFMLMVSVLALPLLVKVAQGVAFISGSTVLLQHIVEVKSPIRMYIDGGEILSVTRYYSWLIIFSPIVLGVFILRLFRSRESASLWLSSSIVFGLLLMLAQFRLHPFGFWALIIGSLVLINEMGKRFNASRLVVSAICLTVLAIAYQPPLRQQLFLIYSPGLTKEYAVARSMYPVLGAACEMNSGIALAYNDDGHPIRYHTDCSVISNNFLLTEQHGKKYIEADSLLQLTPEQFLSMSPDVKYVFARLYGIVKRGPDGFVPTSVEEVEAQNAPLFNALMLRQDLPENFQLLGELRVEDDRDIPFVRVFRVRR